MKKIAYTATAATIALMLAASGASAQSRAKTAKPMAPVATITKLAPVSTSANNVPDNTAHAWTAACYAEFGPDANYPDAALLDKCLN